jgi:hypothetical protein
MSNFFAAIKGITVKIQKNTYYIHMERNFVHFFIKKIEILDPLF